MKNIIDETTKLKDINIALYHEYCGTDYYQNKLQHMSPNVDSKGGFDMYIEGFQIVKMFNEMLNQLGVVERYNEMMLGLITPYVKTTITPNSDSNTVKVHSNLNLTDIKINEGDDMLKTHLLSYMNYKKIALKDVIASEYFRWVLRLNDFTIKVK